MCQQIFLFENKKNLESYKIRRNYFENSELEEELKTINKRF